MGAIVYEHEIWTGSGHNTATLTFADADAELIYSSDWMGQGHQQWTLRFVRRQVSPRFGILRLQSAEYRHNPKRDPEDTLEKLGEIICTAAESDDPADDGMNLPIPYADFEYIVLEGGEPWIAPEPTLEEMAAMGYAGWPNRFDFILFLHYTQETSAEEDGGTHLEDVLRRLDQCKFQSET